MSHIAILVTIISSLLSGLVAVLISSWFYARLERRKLKVDTARRLIGNRFHIEGPDFQRAINEVIIVFADNQTVMERMERLWDVLQSDANDPIRKTADERLISLIKCVCEDVGLS